MSNSFLLHFYSDYFWPHDFKCFSIQVHTSSNLKVLPDSDRGVSIAVLLHDPVYISPALGAWPLLRQQFLHGDLGNISILVISTHQLNHISHNVLHHFLARRDNYKKTGLNLEYISIQLISIPMLKFLFACQPCSRHCMRCSWHYMSMYNHTHGCNSTFIKLGSPFAHTCPMSLCIRLILKIRFRVLVTDVTLKFMIKS